jgi:hypothetical protein
VASFLSSYVNIGRDPEIRGEGAKFTLLSLARDGSRRQQGFYCRANPAFYSRVRRTLTSGRIPSSFLSFPCPGANDMLRLASSVARSIPRAAAAPALRRGYAEAASDRIKLTLVRVSLSPTKSSFSLRMLADLT